VKEVSLQGFVQGGGMEVYGAEPSGGGKQNETTEEENERMDEARRLRRLQVMMSHKDVTPKKICAVIEAEMATRHRHISLEAQALSDADTLFKALPVTPVMLAHRYLAENGVSLRELATKIVGEQRGVHDAGFYFYGREAAAAYSHWASANLELWQCVVEALDDPSVNELLAAI